MPGWTGCRDIRDRGGSLEPAVPVVDRRRLGRVGDRDDRTERHVAGARHRLGARPGGDDGGGSRVVRGLDRVGQLERDAVDVGGARGGRRVDHVARLVQVADRDLDLLADLVADDLRRRAAAVLRVEAHVGRLDVGLGDAEGLDRGDDVRHRLRTGLPGGLDRRLGDRDAEVDPRHVGHDRDLAAARDRDRVGRRRVGRRRPGGRAGPDGQRGHRHDERAQRTAPRVRTVCDIEDHLLPAAR